MYRAAPRCKSECGFESALQTYPDAGYVWCYHVSPCGQPAKVLNLHEMLGYYLDHQKDVVTRRTKYDLNKAEERAHILEGLLIALDNIDEVINIIRSSANTPEAKIV